MKITWIVVADSYRARVFTVDSLSSPLEEVDDLTHLEGRLQDRELTSDLPGKIRSEGGTGGHAFEQPTDPKKHEADNFASNIAHYLEQADNANKINRLLIIADPSFLGLLRKHLSAQLKKKVCFELDKNITEHSVAEIRKHIPTRLPEL